MNDTQLNQLIETTLNPYLVFRVESLNTQEEHDKLIENAGEEINIEDALAYDANTSIVEFKDFDYIFVKSNFYPKFIELLKKSGLKFKMTNCIQELWEMNDLSIFDNGDPAPELTKLAFPDLVNNMDILEQMFKQQFSQDDVLDKITRTGIESLNSIQQQML